MSFNDIEFAVLLILSVTLYLLGLKKREHPLEGRFTGIDLPTSAALKGIACVLILMGHFVARRKVAVDVTSFSMAINYTTANIALTLFMFFSGYGLSLKKEVEVNSLLPVWWSRMKKVYLPLLMTCILTLVIYACLPDRFSLEESRRLTVSKDIWYLHHFEMGYLGTLLSHLLGWKDWYVFCIMAFYTFFYLSKYISRNKPKIQSMVLWFIFIIYFVFAFFYFGLPEAHWYRYCWVFFGGHVYAKMVNSGCINKYDVSMLALLSLTILFEPFVQLINYCLTIIILCVVSKFNKKYTMNSSLLAFMGGISYFFYLSHNRIGYHILIYLEVYSVLLWVGVTIVISLILNRIFELITNKKINK